MRTAFQNPRPLFLGANLVPRAFPLKVGGAPLPPSREKPWKRGCLGAAPSSTPLSPLQTMQRLTALTTFFSLDWGKIKKKRNRRKMIAIRKKIRVFPFDVDQTDVRVLMLCKLFKAETVQSNLHCRWPLYNCHHFWLIMEASKSALRLLWRLAKFWKSA